MLNLCWLFSTFYLYKFRLSFLIGSEKFSLFLGDFSIESSKVNNIHLYHLLMKPGTPLLLLHTCMKLIVQKVNFPCEWISHSLKKKLYWLICSSSMRACSVILDSELLIWFCGKDCVDMGWLCTKRNAISMQNYIYGIFISPYIPDE